MRSSYLKKSNPLKYYLFTQYHNELHTVLDDPENDRAILCNMVKEYNYSEEAGFYKINENPYVEFMIFENAEHEKNDIFNIKINTIRIILIEFNDVDEILNKLVVKKENENDSLFESSSFKECFKYCYDYQKESIDKYIYFMTEVFINKENNIACKLSKFEAYLSLVERFANNSYLVYIYEDYIKRNVGKIYYGKIAEYEKKLLSLAIGVEEKKTKKRRI